MATTTFFSTVPFARLSVLTVLTLASLVLSTTAAHAQQEPPRAREALKQAIDLYKAKDYEKAAPFFTYAQTHVQTLAPADQKDLTEFNSQNDIAMKGRQDGIAQLRLAEDALQQGRTQDLGNLLKSLNSNQYLSPAERQQLAELSRKAQPAPTPATTPSVAGKTDTKSLLIAGRAALQAGDFAAAEALAIQADKSRSLLPTWPWGGDTPDKLKRDIQAAKLKAQVPTPTPVADTMPKNPQVAANEPKASANSSFLGINLWPFGGNSAPAAKKDENDSDHRINEMMARKMVGDAFGYLDSDPGKAHFLAMKAKELNVPFGPNEQTPDMVLHELQRRKGVAAKQTDVPATTANADPKADPKTELPASNDPRVLLKQGRTLLAQKKHEEADKVCNKAVALNGRWGLFEDNPDKLRKDIVRARQAWERDESVRLMADARKLFAAGNIDEAEKKAYKAQQYHGPYGVLEFGDRPQKLIEECQRAKQARGPSSPTDIAVAPKDTNPARTLTPIDVRVPSLQNADKNRAIVMVREARELERKNMLLEAREAAFEARAFKATFAPDEDSPDNVLLSLAAKCNQQIVGHLRVAVQHASSANDPQRFEKAQEQILAARRLAHVFQLDASRIEQTERQVQLAATGRPINNLGSALPPPPNPIQSTLISTGDPQKDQMRRKALERLREAQIELSYGKTAQARRMAQDLAKAEFGIQEEAYKLLRSISAEEYNQQILEAKRTFDAGRDAFVAKDYRKARAIFENIDPLMLPEAYQGRYREFMSTKEMQIDTQGAQPKFLLASNVEPKTNPNDPKTPAPEQDLLEKRRAEEQVRYQAMRQRGQEVLRTASEQYKNNEKEQALETLNRYLDQVKMEQLDAQKTNDLRRLPESRIQQFKAMMTEDIIKGIQVASTGNRAWNENDFQRKILERQREAQEHMKIAGQLYKEKKWTEAEVEARKVRDLDPDNVAAVAMLRQVGVAREQEKVDRGINNQEQVVLDLLDSNPGKIPSTVNDPLIFNPRFAGKTKSSDGSIQHQRQNPKERAIEYRLLQPISFKLKDTPLEQAIETISLESGVPIMIDRKALRDAKVNLESPLTFAAPNIDMKSALNLMLNDLELAYTIENQVLLITTPDRTRGRLVRMTYPVADLIVVVPDHPMPDSLNIVKALESSMRPSGYYPTAIGGMYGASPFSAMGEPVSSHSSGLGAYASKGQSQGQMNNQGGSAPKDRSKDAMAEVLKQLLQDTVAKNTWESMGGQGNIQYFPMGMAMVINQTLEVQEEVQLLLATLRKLQDLQVSIELRAVVVSETFFERIGVDFDMNIKAPKLGGTSALLAGDLATASQKGAVSGLNAAGTLTPDLGFPIRNSSFNFTTPAFGGYQPEAGLSLGLAFLSDIQVFMFLEAVQGDRRAHVMQAPKLTVFNGQQANIAGIVSRPIVTSLAPIPLGDGNVTLQPVFTNIPQGLGMQVQPVVSPDRRFIRLNISPQVVGGPTVDTAGATLQVAPGLANNPPLANNPVSVAITNLQNTSLQIANTTVNVPDGGTVLLGGFKFLAEERTEYGPPVLSKIPYLSRLFRNVGWSRDGATLIYLVTARIIMVEEEERVFLGELPPIPRGQ